MSMKEPYVLIIGSSNIDMNIYSQRLPQKGETVTGGTFKQFLGGKGANQAVASIRSGSKTIFIAKIGKDSFGDKMFSQLKKEGINVNHILRDEKEASGIAFIMIDKYGENMISVAPGANIKLSPKEIEKNEEIIKNATVIVVQMEIPMETIRKVFHIASKGSVKKILNPAPLKPIPQDLLPQIDIIVPNEGELFRLHSLLNLNQIKETQDKKIIQASKDLAKLGIKTIITTLGRRGSLLYQAETEQIIKIPAYKVEAVDTVGAGDCFNGVLASKLAQGENIVNAVKYATAAASIAVTRKGAQQSMPSASEIQDRFNEISHYQLK
ncbi:MAG: ribokinase [Promethearchaeota archaeon]|nr:MAG: ribokinase [Candidatus Lokiarchaeota archaeon]